VLGSLFKKTAVSGAHSRERFEQLMSQSYTHAYALAYRLTGNSAEAEDLVQETYIRAFRFFHRFNPELAFSSWLNRIMTNAHIDTIRRKSKLKVSSLDHAGCDGDTVWDVPDSHSSPDRVLLDDMVEESLQLALKAMTPEFRIAVLLADVEGLSYEEIAESLEVSVGTIRSRIHRGRKQLREYLSVEDKGVLL
jgi:RNA polymerase sigma-70 factor (ECF subfamily)